MYIANSSKLFITSPTPKIVYKHAKRSPLLLFLLLFLLHFYCWLIEKLRGLPLLQNFQCVVLSLTVVSAYNRHLTPGHLCFASYHILYQFSLPDLSARVILLMPQCEILFDMICQWFGLVVWLVEKCLEVYLKSALKPDWRQIKDYAQPAKRKTLISIWES